MREIHMKFCWQSWKRRSFAEEYPTLHHLSTHKLHYNHALQCHIKLPNARHLSHIIHFDVLKTTTDVLHFFFQRVGWKWPILWPSARKMRQNVSLQKTFLCVQDTWKVPKDMQDQTTAINQIRSSDALHLFQKLFCFFNSIYSKNSFVSSIAFILKLLFLQ